MIEETEQAAFQHKPQDTADDDRHRQSQPHRAPVPGHQKRHVGADHEQRAVGQIDDAHDAEYERQPARDQKQQQAVLNSIEELREKSGKIHGAAYSRTCKREPARLIDGPARVSASSQFAARARVRQVLGGDADHFVLAALDFAQVDVLRHILCRRHADGAARAVDLGGAQRLVEVGLVLDVAFARPRGRRPAAAPRRSPGRRTRRRRGPPCP